MNYIWAAMVMLSLVVGAATGRADAVLQAGLEGAGAAVTAALGFAGIMCFWSGVLALCDKGGLAKVMSKMLSPLLSKIFGRDSKALPHIAMNVTANLLGMGNAATPSGIRAMQELDRENGREVPSRAMSIFAVMNTSSLQIVPATVAAMRASAGAAQPFDIVAAVWITSAVSLAASVAAALLLVRKND